MACTMYKIKPLIELTDDDFIIKSSMYVMRNFQNISDMASDERSEDSILCQIENEQDLMLKKFNTIKELLTKIKTASTKIDNQENTLFPKMSMKKPDLALIGIIHDVVLNANYKKPPFSLLAINKIWPDILNVTYNCHIHSSVVVLPKNLNIFENLTNPSSSDAQKLRVRVVWKEMPSDCELIISPFSSVPLVGEVNFLRFLHSCVTPVNSDPYLQTLFDVKLDACYSLAYYESVQQLQECLSILSEGLQFSKWMFGGDPTIIDVAAWSALKNIKKINMPETLSAWFQQCEVFFKTIT